MTFGSSRTSDVPLNAQLERQYVLQPEDAVLHWKGVANGRRLQLNLCREIQANLSADRGLDSDLDLDCDQRRSCLDGRHKILQIVGSLEHCAAEEAYGYGSAHSERASASN